MRSEAVLIRSLGVFYYILISIANLVSSEARVRLSNLNYPRTRSMEFSTYSKRFVSTPPCSNHCSIYRPRQVISAINIPLSVMLGPILACRLVSGFYDLTKQPNRHLDFGLERTRFGDCCTLRRHWDGSLYHKVGLTAGFSVYATKSAQQERNQPIP